MITVMPPCRIYFSLSTEEEVQYVSLDVIPHMDARFANYTLLVVGSKLPASDHSLCLFLNEMKAKPFIGDTKEIQKRINVLYDDIKWQGWAAKTLPLQPK